MADNTSNSTAVPKAVDVNNDATSTTATVTATATAQLNIHRKTALSELKISRRSKREFSVPVHSPGAKVAWRFNLHEYDVGFGAYFVPQVEDLESAAESPRVTIKEEVGMFSDSIIRLLSLICCFASR